MKVRVDVTRCMGHSMCNAIAPDVYEVTEMGFNEMGEFEVSPAQEQAARRGARACPERIIAILDDDSA
jgi:ferredoxin